MSNILSSFLYLSLPSHICPKVVVFEIYCITFSQFQQYLNCLFSRTFSIKGTFTLSWSHFILITAYMLLLHFPVDSWAIFVKELQCISSDAIAVHIHLYWLPNLSIASVPNLHHQVRQCKFYLNIPRIGLRR